jgi:hypothetical protein
MSRRVVVGSQARFGVNAPAVVGEVVDDEVIVINLETGTYYSLSDVGGVVWQEFEAGASVEEVKDLVENCFDGDRALISIAIDDFVRDLEVEGLIVPVEAADVACPRDVARDSIDRVTKPFVAPRLERYIELQNMIQLDPILEVDNRGWPKADRQ